MCYNKVPSGRQCMWEVQGARSDITELGLKSASILCLDSRMRILRLAWLYLTVCWASCIVSLPTSKTQPCYNKLLRMVVPLRNNTQCILSLTIGDPTLSWGEVDQPNPHLEHEAQSGASRSLAADKKQACEKNKVRTNLFHWIVHRLEYWLVSFCLSTWILKEAASASGWWIVIQIHKAFVNCQF